MILLLITLLYIYYIYSIYRMYIVLGNDSITLLVVSLYMVVVDKSVHKSYDIWLIGYIPIKSDGGM
jgi:hypothetical protein